MPTKSLFGVKVTAPVGSIVYVPTVLPSLVAGIVVSSVPTNLAGLSVVGFNSVPSACLYVGIPVCALPWISVDVAGVAVGATGL